MNVGRLVGYVVGAVLATAIGVALITRVPPLAKLIFNQG